MSRSYAFSKRRAWKLWAFEETFVEIVCYRRRVWKPIAFGWGSRGYYALSNGCIKHTLLSSTPFFYTKRALFCLENIILALLFSFLFFKAGKLKWQLLFTKMHQNANNTLQKRCFIPKCGASLTTAFFWCLCIFMAQGMDFTSHKWQGGFCIFN